MKQLRTSQVYIIMKFIVSLAHSTIFTTYAIYYVTELGLNPLQLVLIGTALELTALLFEGVTGVVADTYSRRISVIIGMFIFGIGSTFVSGADTAWVVDEIGEDQVGSIFMRSQRISLIAALIGIAISVGAKRELQCCR